MFMQIAIGAIGIGVVLMVGYIVVSQVRAALPTDTGAVQTANECVGQVGGDAVSPCVNVSTVYTFPDCGSNDLAAFNTTSIVSCPNVGASAGTASVQATVFAGFGLIAVGIVVLAAFGLINIFK